MIKSTGINKDFGQKESAAFHDAPLKMAPLRRRISNFSTGFFYRNSEDVESPVPFELYASLRYKKVFPEHCIHRRLCNHENAPAETRKKTKGARRGILLNCKL